MSDADIPKRIVDAALSLASERAWADVAMADIASRAGLGLAEMARHVASKSDILAAFSRLSDQALLASLTSDPVEGGPHDRLFDAMLRRIELLAPHKRAIASILAGPGLAPAEWASLLCSLSASQGWTLVAAGLDGGGPRGDLRKLGLAKIHVDTLRVWVEDDDPGLARTMATLDRKLRDAESWAQRLETPLAVAGGLLKAWRQYRSAPPQSKPQDGAAHATAD